MFATTSKARLVFKRSLKSFSPNTGAPLAVSTLYKPLATDDIFSTYVPSLSKKLALVSTRFQFKKWGLLQKSNTVSGNSAKCVPSDILKVLFNLPNITIDVPIYKETKTMEYSFSGLSKCGRTKINENVENALLQMYKLDASQRPRDEMIKDLEFKASIKISTVVPKVIKGYFPDRPCIVKLKYPDHLYKMKDIHGFNKEAVYAIIGFLSLSENPVKVQNLLTHMITKPIIDKVVERL